VQSVVGDSPLAPCAIEDLRADLPFEPIEPAPERGLRRTERSGGGVQRAMPRYCESDLQVVPVHVVTRLRSIRDQSES
jgi:hypothetical protein